MVIANPCEKFTSSHSVTNTAANVVVTDNGIDVRCTLPQCDDLPIHHGP